MRIIYIISKLKKINLEIKKYKKIKLKNNCIRKNKIN